MVAEFEDQRWSDLDAKHDALKIKTASTIFYNYINGIFTCRQCLRSFTNKIGYVAT